MYYFYLGKKGDFSSPEKLIIEYQNHWYERKKTTDWKEMEEEDQTKLLNGSDVLYYGIEKEDFDNILSSWGGSRFGYKNIDSDHLHDGEESDYGNERD